MRVNSIITTDYVFSSYIFLNLSVKLTVVFKRIFGTACYAVIIVACYAYQSLSRCVSPLGCCMCLCFIVCGSVVCVCVWQCCVCVCYGVIVCVRVMDVHQV